MSVVISSRFNGPPTTGNGGYSCGMLAARLGACAEVTLRRPPPLDRALRVESDESGLRLLDGELLVASARPAELDLAIPEPPTYEQALAAESEFMGFDVHQFPTCFVCGPRRDDGLRLFTGKVTGRELVASGWTPDASVAGPDGNVVVPVVWSALDCPTFFAGCMTGGPLWALLGRQTAKLLAPIPVGEPHVVIAWPLGKQGRKFEGGSAVFSKQGELRAYGRALWIEVSPPG